MSEGPFSHDAGHIILLCATLKHFEIKAGDKIQQTIHVHIWRARCISFSKAV